MGPADPALAVCVAYSQRAGEVDEVQIQLPSCATVQDALNQSGLLQRHADIDVAESRIGVWSKLRALDHVLRDCDRVEIYRPLQVDPKEGRRLHGWHRPAR